LSPIAAGLAAQAADRCAAPELLVTIDDDHALHCFITGIHHDDAFLFGVTGVGWWCGWCRTQR
jgi:hypothetical protein